MGKKPWPKMVVDVLNEAGSDEGLSPKEILHRIMESFSVEHDKSSLDLVTHELKKGLETGEFLQVKGNSVHGTFKLNEMFALPAGKEAILPSTKEASSIDVNHKAPIIPSKPSKKPPPSMRKKSPAKPDIKQAPVKKALRLEDIVSPEFLERAKNDPYCSVKRMTYNTGQFHTVDLLKKKFDSDNKQEETNLDIDDEVIEKKKDEMPKSNPKIINFNPKPLVNPPTRASFNDGETNFDIDDDDDVSDKKSNVPKSNEKPYIHPSVLSFMQDDNAFLNMLGSIDISNMTMISGSIPAKKTKSVPAKKFPTKKVSIDKPVSSTIVNKVSNDKPALSTEKPVSVPANKGSTDKFVSPPVNKVSTIVNNSSSTKKPVSSIDIDTRPSEQVVEKSKTVSLTDKPTVSAPTRHTESDLLKKEQERVIEKNKIDLKKDEEKPMSTKVSDDTPTSTVPTQNIESDSLKIDEEEVNLKIGEIMNRGVIPKLVEDLKSRFVFKYVELQQLNALWLLCELVSGTVNQKVAVIKLNALPTLIKLISSANFTTINSAIDCLFNLAETDSEVCKRMFFDKLDTTTLGISLDQNFDRFSLDSLRMSSHLVMEVFFRANDKFQELADNFERFLLKCVNCEDKSVIIFSLTAFRFLITYLRRDPKIELSEQELSRFVTLLKHENNDIRVLSLHFIIFSVLESQTYTAKIDVVHFLEIIFDCINNNEMIAAALSCLTRVVRYHKSCSMVVLAKDVLNKIIQIGIDVKKDMCLLAAYIVFQLINEVDLDSVARSVDVSLFNTFYTQLQIELQTDENLRPYMPTIQKLYEKLNP